MNRIIAVLTSGGDAPGMNAAVRSVVRVAAAKGYIVHGSRRGFEGLISDDFIPLTTRSVSNIIHRGGTMLRTARSKDFMTIEGRTKAAEHLRAQNVSALIGIGGDGTFHGLKELAEIWDGQIIGVPGTIDNDLYGSDFTIGFDTAINTALDSIDRIRDTAEAHERFFLVEVMGRWAGYIALDVTIAGGAEYVVLPDADGAEPIDHIAKILHQGRERGKTTGIVVVSERGKAGASYEIAKALEAMGPQKVRVAILGYIQRGGSPTARDRILATKLGAWAVDLVEQGQTEVMAGERSGQLVSVPLEETWTRKDEKPLDAYLMSIMPALAQ